MTDNELIDWCKSQVITDHVIDIPDNMFALINEDQAKLILNFFTTNTLFKLPQSEINFFEWLRENEESVWDDLWKDEVNPPYFVSLIFLPIIVKGGYRGFPICDLLNNENHYFVPAHLAERDSEIFLESSKTRFLNKETLTVPQLLTIEISMNPIDIWHFAYKHKIEIAEAKKAVASLANDELLVHLKEAEHIANFIDF